MNDLLIFFSEPLLRTTSHFCHILSPIVNKEKVCDIMFYRKYNMQPPNHHADRTLCFLQDRAEEFGCTQCFICQREWHPLLLYAETHKRKHFSFLALLILVTPSLLVPWTGNP